MKLPPFTRSQIEHLVTNYPTPFYLYDEQGIRNSARKLIDAFHWNNGFKEFFAVKATPNPSILEILIEEGCGADCSSLSELVLAERVGLTGENIILTSNDTPAEEFVKARQLGALINLDDLSHLPYLERHAGLPELISFRYNPGTDGGNSIIGEPREAKFGATKSQIFEGYKLAKQKGVKRFGLHTMIASNELDPRHFITFAEMLFDLAAELRTQLGIDLEFINLGGGLGIPYEPDQHELDLPQLSQAIQRVFAQKDIPPATKIFMECGRYITGPHGYLIAQVSHMKDTYKKFVGLDASMADLMRPAMYGAYHHITILGKEGAAADHTYDITGSLCENNDKFAIDRKLPRIEIGDLVVIHDAGAHGHAMGFNYNGKLRPAELLLRSDGTVRMIRRAETLDDHFATLSF